MALANGVGAEFFLLYGLQLILLPALVVVTVEAVVLALVARLPFSGAWRLVFQANLVSLFAGLPLIYVFGKLSEQMVDLDLHLFQASYLRFVFLKYAGYFALSSLVEGALLLWWQRRHPSQATAGQIALGIVAANAISYMAIGPFYYWVLRPDHAVKQYAATVGRYDQKPQTVLYIDRQTRHLMQIKTNGQGRSTVVPVAMDDYLIDPGLEKCVFARDGKVWRWERGGAPLLIGQITEHNWPLSDPELGELLPTGAFGPSQSQRHWHEMEERGGYSTRVYREMISGFEGMDSVETTVRISDGMSGLIRRPNHKIGDAALLGSGRHCVFDEREGCGLYIADLREGRVGFLAAGSHFALITERYRAGPASGFREIRLKISEGDVR